MWIYACEFLLLFVLVSAEREKERIFRQEIHSLKRELQDQLDILRDEISQERKEFMALWDLYQTKCKIGQFKKNSMGKKNEEILTLKADIKEYSYNLEILKKKLESARYAFRSEKEMVDTRKRLSELERHKNQLKFYLKKEKEYPLKLTDEAERLRHEIFFLTHFDEQKLDAFLPTTVQWMPVNSRPEFSDQPKAVLEVKIKVCTPVEPECEIQDITPLSDYSFIVTYFQHKFIRHFRRDGLLLNELAFPWYLRGSLGLNSTHALIGVPQNKTIMLLSFGRSIDVRAHIKFDSECAWDIDILDDYYVVLCHRPNSIRIYTKEWRWVRMIWKDSQKELLINPWFLTVNALRRQIMVSDFNFTGVSSFDEYGNLLWTTQDTDTITPRGMLTDPNGDWLVCDELENVVVRLSPTGKYVEDVLQINSPRAIAWLKNPKNSGLYKQKFLIGSSTGFIYIVSLR